MMTQMTKFMEKDIITEDTRQTYQIKIEIYIVLCRAAAPVGGIMFDCNPVVCEIISESKNCQSFRKLLLRLPAHLLYLFLGAYRHIGISCLLLCRFIDYPASVAFEESDSNCIGNKIWHHHRYSLDRMDSDTYPPASYTLAEQHIT